MDTMLKSFSYKSDPFEIFHKFKDKKNAFFLDSSYNLFGLGRYSIIGFEPFCVIKSNGSQNIFPSLRGLLGRYTIKDKVKLPFLGGAAGFFSYDLGFALEGKVIHNHTVDDLRLPTSIIGFYDCGIIFDQADKKMIVFSTGMPEKGFLAEKKARERLRRITGHLGTDNNPRYSRGKIKRKNKHTLGCNFIKEDYIAAIKKAKEYIRKGDIYQVNLSQRFHAESDLDSFSLYSRLRKISPNPFGAYFNFGDFQVLSSSPERFLHFDGLKVQTRPMKGTRPRSRDGGKDKALSEQLLNSHKDKAELLMITDLERNDLGKVCKYTTVKVRQLRTLEKYSHVFQTTATIEGLLHKDKDRVDLIKACFPGGSITGCPKVRSMQIIEELEPTRRNTYTGSLGYLGFNNTMDLNILIRTIVKKDNKIYFGVGGGIVADSNPDKEYAETLVKAKALIQALDTSI